MSFSCSMTGSDVGTQEESENYSYAKTFDYESDTDQGTEIDILELNDVMDKTLLMAEARLSPHVHGAKMDALGASGQNDVRYVKLQPINDICSTFRTRNCQESPAPFTKTGIREESCLPRNVMHPPGTCVGSPVKPFGQSLVDVFAEVLAPFHYSHNSSRIPSILEANEVSSVGDLTATTYECQVDIEKLQQKLGRLETKHPSPNEPNAFPDDNYFSDYQAQNRTFNP